MRKFYLIIVMNLLLIDSVLAQKETDWELQRLINVVSTLRQSDQKTWDKAKRTFSQDSLWTPLDEIQSDSEYIPVGNKQFKLNAILNGLSGYTRKMVRGDFLNGNDPNYDYSLTERGIKKGCTVSYEMSYREGHQTFVVMPYKKTDDKMEVKAFHNGKPVGDLFTDDEGNVHLSIDDKIKLRDKLELDITNHADEDMPVVIINHNTRKN